jgi:erythromycin esterase
MKFTVFSIEANMPEAYRLNEFVLTGHGDPKELLKGMYFWTWNTEEVLDMILWMREFNQSGKGHIEFTGFDMQTPTMAAQNVRDFVMVNDYPDAVSEVDRAIRLSSGSGVNGLGRVNYSAAALAWKEVIEDLETSCDMYLSNGVEQHEIDWVIQNAQVAREAMQMQSSQVSRDNSMARNLEWIANQSAAAKIVVWAHNGHVARQPGAMGFFLAERYGKNYLPIEFAFHDGRYNAVGPKGLRAYDASPSFPGSAEYIFHESGMSQFILDLRKASLVDPASAWIHGDIQYRNIGAVAADGFAPRTDLAKYSDAVIFFDHSSPSALLPF